MCGVISGGVDVITRPNPVAKLLPTAAAAALVDGRIKAPSRAVMNFIIGLSKAETRTTHNPLFECGPDEDTFTGSLINF